MRFTRVLFGLAPSPFLLAAVIKAHLHRYKMVNPELVDDLISGGETIKQTLEIKMTATAILGEAAFKLHKWIGRFLHNIRTVRKQRVVGRLLTEEIQKQTTFWIKRAQQQANSSEKFQDRLQLNVQGNQEGIF